MLYIKEIKCKWSVTSRHLYREVAASRSLRQVCPWISTPFSESDHDQVYCWVSLTTALLHSFHYPKDANACSGICPCHDARLEIFSHSLPLSMPLHHTGCNNLFQRIFLIYVLKFLTASYWSLSLCFSLFKNRLLLGGRGVVAKCAHLPKQWSELKLQRRQDWLIRPVRLWNPPSLT